MTRAVRIAIGAFCFLLVIAAGIWLGHRARLAKRAAATRQLAERGDASAEAELGTDYYYGRGVPRDYGQAFLWARKAAAQGSSRAEYDLGYLYQFGQGTTKDDSQAFIWFQKSANQGEKRAQDALGVMYYYGLWVREDRSIAVDWYRKAAQQGFPGAEYALGYCFKYAQGVQRDFAEGDRWIRKAAAQGYKPAQQELGLRGYGFSTRQTAFWLAETAACLWIFVVSKPFTSASADRQRRTLMKGSLLLLLYVALRVYWAYGLFPSVFVVYAFAAIKGIVLGIGVVLLASAISPKASGALVIFSWVLLAITIGAIFFVAVHHVPGRPIVTPFCSLAGLLLGVLIAVSVSRRSRSAPPAEVAA